MNTSKIEIILSLRNRATVFENKSNLLFWVHIILIIMGIGIFIQAPKFSVQENYSPEESKKELVKVTTQISEIRDFIPSDDLKRLLNDFEIAQKELYTKLINEIGKPPRRTNASLFYGRPEEGYRNSTNRNELRNLYHWANISFTLKTPRVGIKLLDDVSRTAIYLIDEHDFKIPLELKNSYLKRSENEVSQLEQLAGNLETMWENELTKFETEFAGASHNLSSLLAQQKWLENLEQVLINKSISPLFNTSYDNGSVGFASDIIFWLDKNLIRFGPIIIMLTAAFSLNRRSRYLMRLSVHYNDQADALSISSFKMKDELDNFVQAQRVTSTEKHDFFKPLHQNVNTSENRGLISAFQDFVAKMGDK